MRVTCCVFRLLVYVCTCLRQHRGLLDDFFDARYLRGRKVFHALFESGNESGLVRFGDGEQGLFGMLCHVFGTAGLQMLEQGGEDGRVVFGFCGSGEGQGLTALSTVMTEPASMAFLISARRW